MVNLLIEITKKLLLADKEQTPNIRNSSMRIIPQQETKPEVTHRNKNLQAVNLPIVMMVIIRPKHKVRDSVKKNSQRREVLMNSIWSRLVL